MPTPVITAYLCPVCGYSEMSRPPAECNICPCCFTEFGVSNVGWSNAELREDWIARGALWSDPDVNPPAGWDPIAQLRETGYELTKSERESIRFAHENTVCDLVRPTQATWITFTVGDTDSAVEVVTGFVSSVRFVSHLSSSSRVYGGLPACRAC